ncbi:MAG: DMT family transporter [Candidatus Neomarinimicrobiota bacterium]|nr:DMT family transporter [Candidatus Neomarinimicrobiota bacterium]
MGELFSLLSAFFWASAIILFKKLGKNTSPILINAFKNLFGVILIFFSLYLINHNPIKIPDFIDSNDIFILIISGAIGLGVADILFLKSLNIVGAGVSALVDIMYSPFVLIFAYLILNERLHFIQIVGGLLIFLSVIYASYKLKNISISRLELIKGVILGIFALLLMAFCIVMIKPILNKTNILTNHLWVAGFRMIPGMLVPLLLSFILLSKKELFVLFESSHNMKLLISGSFFATYLGISFWIIGMANTKTSIAAILNQTASFFILILARIFLGEYITKRKAISIIVASFGAILIVLYGK